MSDEWKRKCKKSEEEVGPNRTRIRKKIEENYIQKVKKKYLNTILQDRRKKKRIVLKSEIIKLCGKWKQHGGRISGRRGISYPLHTVISYMKTQKPYLGSFLRLSFCEFNLCADPL